MTTIQSQQLIEPFLIPNDQRHVLFPIHHTDIWKMCKTQQDSSWRVEEVDLSKDLDDWNNKLNDDEKYFISSILAFFASSDGIVTENLATRFYEEIQVPEIRYFYAGQIQMESVHGEMYSLLIDTYIENPIQKDKLFRATETYPCIRLKAQWAQKWIEDRNSSFTTRLVAFCVVESLFFSASFASLYWIKKRGLMHGLTLSNSFIASDEQQHAMFAVLIYSKLQNKLSDAEIHMMIQEAVEIEKNFISESIPCRLIGMNVALMCQYIEFVADRLCVQLNAPKIFNATNPFDFMELISLDSKVNFFERINSQYSLANKTVTQDTFDFSDSDTF
jgi:ribonucleotide reductase beta subunit family protein with ferritin-like domain